MCNIKFNDIKNNITKFINNKKPKFSIITVCLNEEKNISTTIESILNQDSNDYELIVCDGGSKDQTYDIILTYRKKFASKGIRFYCSSRKDGGIYQGMNNGIKKAKGEYYIFMNGGDNFHSNDVLTRASQIIETDKNIDVLYGNYMYINGNYHTVSHTNIKSIRFKEIINHQSSFILGRWLKERKYLTNYKIASDYEYWLYMLSKNAKFCHTEIIVANFNANGLSSNYEITEAEVDEINKEYPSLMKIFHEPESDDEHFYSYDDDYEKLNNLNFGWGTYEYLGVWASGQKSVFSFTLNKKKNICLQLTIAMTNDYQNELYVNDCFVYKIGNFIGDHLMYIDKSYLREGRNYFAICAKDEVQPFKKIQLDSFDFRKINLLIAKTAIYDDREHLKCDEALCYGSFFGWSIKEGDYCWAIGNTTGFAHYVKQLEGFYLNFSIKITMGYHNKLYVNDILLSELDYEPKEYRLYIEKKYLKLGVNTFIIKADEEVLPSYVINKQSNDIRKLNLFIGNIQYTENN